MAAAVAIISYVTASSACCSSPAVEFPDATHNPRNLLKGCAREKSILFRPAR